MKEFIYVMRHYAVFEGRASRREYWMFTLVYLVLFLLISAVDYLIGLSGMLYGLGLLSGILSLACLCPSLAVAVRRLHDIGRSGWWVLLVLIPFFGGIVLLVFAAMPGQQSANRFGDIPVID